MEELTTESFNNLVQRVSGLAQGPDNFGIAENYFSDILNAQLLIFSLIIIILVTICVGLYFIFIPRISKNQIKREVKNAIKNIKKDLKEEQEKKYKDLNNDFESRFKNFAEKFNKKLTGARGEIFRMFGQYLQDKKSYYPAFLWWLRSAREFSSAPGAEKGVRIALKSAITMIRKVESYELDSDGISEYQNILKQIDDEVYKAEKEALEEAFKKLFGKQFKENK